MSAHQVDREDHEVLVGLALPASEILFISNTLRDVLREFPEAMYISIEICGRSRTLPQVEKDLTQLCPCVEEPDPTPCPICFDVPRDLGSTAHVLRFPAACKHAIGHFLGRNSQRRALPCGHSFCGACIMSWFERHLLAGTNLTCPVCRGTVLKCPDMGGWG